MGYLTHGATAGGKTYDLLLCPFCGGEAEFRDGSSTKPYIRCKSCGCRTGSSSNADRLKEAWNRRAERTCHIDMPVIDWETGETDYVCSVCGFSADPQDWAETYDYCPRCGSRVVTADADR